LSQSIEKAVCERRLPPADKNRLDLFLRSGVEPKLELPVRNVGLQDMRGERRRQGVEARAIAAIEGRPRGEKVGVALGGRGHRDARERQRTNKGPNEFVTRSTLSRPGHPTAAGVFSLADPW
jgi:hypothetical protein